MPYKMQDGKQIFYYSVDDPQPAPSPLLAEYMRANNIDKSMSVEDAKKWFDGLRETLNNSSKGRKANV